MWTIDECPDANGFATIRPKDCTSCGDTDAQPIATVYDAANAQIIAAAPVTLAAARRVIEWLDSDCDPSAKSVDALRAAIAAATVN